MAVALAEDAVNTVNEIMKDLENEKQ